MSATHAVLLTAPAAAANDERLAVLLRFLGVPCDIVRTDGALPTIPGGGIGGRDCGLIISAVTLRILFDRPGLDHQQIQSYIDRFDSVLIYGVAPLACSEEDLRLVTGGVAGRLAELPAGAKFLISDKHRSVCGSLSGLHIDRRTSGATHGIRVESMAGDVDTLIGVADQAVFMRLRRENSGMFLATVSQVVNLEERVSSNFDAVDIFEGLVPFVMYARAVFPDVCWNSNGQHACLIIDDPLLRRRYGFLNLVELLKQLAKLRIAANLAFIPWNSERSSRAIAALVRDADSFALCVHGCDHTRAEFGSDDDAWLDTLTELALERMDEHQEQTGISYERIMVFPQGFFSECAMSVLKRRNFIAAVNTEIIPQHPTDGPGNVSLGSLLGMAITEFDSFPLFTRRNCTDPFENYALDIFLGKPCLLVAHHQYFQDGFTPLAELAAALNQFAPEMKWTTLENVLKESYQWRRLPGGVTAVRMFANQMSLKNSEAVPVHFKITKPERDGSAVSRVLVNQAVVTFDWDTDGIQFLCDLESGQSAVVRVEYKASEYRERREPGLRYRARSAARRYLSEFRDDYVQPLKHLLQGARH